MMVENIGFEPSQNYFFNERSRVKFNNVAIHIDLKGAPPKFEFLMDFVNYFGKKSGE